MQFTAEQKNGFVIIRFRGTLIDSSPTCGHYYDYVYARIAEGCRTFILNFEDVKRVNSYGVGLLIASHKLMWEVGGKIVACNTQSVDAFFCISKMDKLFAGNIFKTEDDALAACTAP